MIQLSNIAPDYDSIVIQLQNALITKPAWTDRVTSSTGQTLVEMIAAVGAYSQFAIESAFQENWPESAKNFESIFAAANFAGVRLARKSPASVEVSMSAPVPTVVPINSQFTGANGSWFNRSALSLTSTPSSVTLYEGVVTTAQMYGLGTDFQAFVSVERDFSVSDTDVFLTVDSVSIPVTMKGLWLRESLPGVWQFTLPGGQLIVLFGNDIYGTKPDTNNLCEFTYVTTIGIQGNNLPTIGKKFSLETDALINGTGTSQATGGADQISPLVYKTVTPAMFGAFGSSVTANQYKKLPLTYPGVVDAIVLAQREVNPRAVTWMNVFKVCLLTTSVWTTPQWAAFEQFFYDSSMYSGRIFRQDPTALPVTVTAQVYCSNFSDLPGIKTKVEAALDRLYELRQGILGLDIYLSDVLNAIQDSDSNIEYVKLLAPTSDLIISSQNAEAPTLVEQIGLGTLPIANYDYAISVVSSLGGETAPAFYSNLTTTAINGRISITWPRVPTAASYKVWGRSGLSLGLIGTVADTGAPTYTFLDDGTVPPVGPLPSESTVGFYYPDLTTKNITTLYSTRGMRLE
jgi:hypothetical protein